MAVNWRNVSGFTGQIDISDLANFPYGKAQNITNPGDGTGTPWDELVINDIFGLQQWLLNAANITPNGSNDNIQTSQYGQALQTLFAQRSNNLSDLADPTTARGNLGLGSVATRDVGTADTSAALISRVIGWNQTWQEVSASRAFNIIYTNNTGKPIQIHVGATSNITNQTLTCTIDESIAFTGANATNPGDNQSTVSVIIPNGSRYRLNMGGTSISLFSWIELR